MGYPQLLGDPTSIIQAPRERKRILSHAIRLCRGLLLGVLLHFLMLAKFVLHWARFPAGASVGQVSDDAVWRLGAYPVPTILTTGLLIMAVISACQLDRAGHEEAGLRHGLVKSR